MAQTIASVPQVSHIHILAPSKFSSVATSVPRLGNNFAVKCYWPTTESRKSRFAPNISHEVDSLSQRVVIHISGWPACNAAAGWRRCRRHPQMLSSAEHTCVHVLLRIRVPPSSCRPVDLLLHNYVATLWLR